MTEQLRRRGALAAVLVVCAVFTAWHLMFVGAGRQTVQRDGDAHIVQLDPREWKAQQQPHYNVYDAGKEDRNVSAPTAKDASASTQALVAHPRQMPVLATDASAAAEANTTAAEAATTKSTSSSTTTTTATTTTTTTAKEMPERRRYMYIIDYWERLNNIHAAMRLIIRLARVSKFTLVEPFMYESMVMQRLATPIQFAQTGIEVQTASKYMNLESVFNTGYFTTYEDFVAKVAKRVDAPKGKSKNTTALVDAALHIFWDDAEVALPPNQKQALFECEDVFQKLGKKHDKEKGWRIAPGFHARTPLCIFGEKINTSLPKDDFIKYMFETVEATIPQGEKTTVCADCSSLVILNYRKHFFDSLHDPNSELEWFDPMPPSVFGMGLARTVHEKELHNRSYVAIQYRTGRTLTRIRQMAQGHEETDGVRGVVADEYRTWAFTCANLLIARAQALTREMRGEKGLSKGEATGYFLASDMFNEGWKHGEYNNPETETVMADLARYFEDQLGGLVTFQPETVGLTQDVMGLSAVGDAAVCYAADKFVAHDSSSMGWYVGECRQQWRHLNSSIEDCPEPEHNATVVRRIDEAIVKVQAANDSAKQ